MQNWARRGTRSALNTSGMLAGDSQVPPSASVPDDGHVRWWGGGIADGVAHHTGDMCSTGELYPYAEAPTGRHHLVPPPQEPQVRARYDAFDDALTIEIPAVGARGAPTGTPIAPMRLAGWVAEAPDATSPHVGTPSEGFHRTMGWSGPIGAVVPGDQHLHAPLPDDSATVETAGLALLWEAASTTAATAAGAPLLAANALDLTSSKIDDLLADLYTVPYRLLSSVLSTEPLHQRPRQSDFVPLHVPGEHQERAEDPPNLSTLTFGWQPPSAMDLLTSGPTEPEVPSRIFDALSGSRTPTPTSRHIEPVPGQPSPAFGGSRSTAAVLDRLHSAVPDRPARSLFERYEVAEVWTDQTLPIPAVEEHRVPALAMTSEPPPPR